MKPSITDISSAAGEESKTHSPVRILHLEDNLPYQVMLEEILANNGLVCEFCHVSEKNGFETALQKGRFDLIISDFSLPGYDGMQALLAAQKAQPAVPFMFVSGTIGEERAVEGLKCGAVDYVVKEHSQRLVPAVRRALREGWEKRQRMNLEEQLRQAQKMEAIGQLAGGIAHDFNNLLAVIRGNVELVLLRNGPMDEETRECLKQVTGASDRAASLTRRLLAFGRKQTMRAEALNLNDVIKNLARMLKRFVGAHIQLDCTFVEPQSFVHADAGMLEQVLVNLVVNARDAMPHGGQLLITTKRVKVNESQSHAHPEARTGEFICWTVSDNGTGIAPAHLPHIFEPFYSTKEYGKGTGLGLSMAHGIVKQHQGWIEVVTLHGVGTSFKIFLPAIPHPPRADAVEPRAGTLPGGSERILLAENEPGMRLLTRRLLETFGYEVLEATSGREAMEMSDGEVGKIDLLVVSLVLSDGVTGPDLAERLRKQWPELHAIFVSSHGLDLFPRNPGFLKQPGNCFLQKPCASPVLLSAVRRCLDEIPRQSPA